MASPHFLHGALSAKQPSQQPPRASP